ncbi:DNA-binding transcriptional regulator, LysR family [Methylobacterium sp. UNC300MFChir4.1]|uniref:LysR family transcriptional regulator n=1 Tax=Methylobacterium sp. UNC300MFChir4.1 TaxID=1502747 RepID=UPI0008CDF569|nr:LysR family transcriptional regulator [Methylobacterium sp. UNC300MFChir4.1]SEN71373.1 DNA-binding transcriptional regulator, LysR family [Methylobacterium sp. UNC300MFChir4.1]
MDLDWVRDFLALAEHRTFSRAAEVRHVTQPAFSRRIRALEAWLGTPLFLRSAQGAHLTAAGTGFRPHAEELMRGLDRACREARAAGARADASLAIAATHALSFTFFPGWIRRHAPFETLGALNLISDSMAACEAILLAGEVQLLLCHHRADLPTPLDDGRCESVRVGADSLVPLCAPTSEGAPLWPLSGAVRYLAYGEASGLGRILAASGAAAGHGPAFTSHLAATLMTMAQGGDGVAWLPVTLAEAAIARGQLVRAGPEELDVPVEIRLFRMREGRGGAADALWRRLQAPEGARPDQAFATRA